MCYRLLLLGLSALLLFSLISASAAANIIPKSNLDEIHRQVTADDKKPSACGAQHIERLITGTGVISGTSDNDLILGGPGADTISGEGGDDCIVGGGGGDTLIGSSGDDTCIGGPGSDTLDATCERREP
jgi:Ca2+-binding RTX toxin-like protein